MSVEIIVCRILFIDCNRRISCISLINSVIIKSVKFFAFNTYLIINAFTEKKLEYLMQYLAKSVSEQLDNKSIYLSI